MLPDCQFRSHYNERKNSAKLLEFSEISINLAKIMKPSFSSPLVATTILAFCLISGSSARAATQYAPPPQKEEGFADRVGGFFHKLFNGHDQQAPPPPVRRSQQKRPTPAAANATRYNLDSPPAGVAQLKYASNNASSNQSGPPTTSQRTPRQGESVKPNQAANSSTQPAPRKPAETQPRTSNSPQTVANPPARTPAPPQTSVEPAPSKTLTEAPATNDSASKSVSDEKTTVTPPPQPRNTFESSPTKAAPSGGTETLTATRINKPGRVKSPYAPFSELDVTGLSSGALAMDPTTNRVFRVP
jgi:hypothetical protein